MNHMRINQFIFFSGNFWTKLSESKGQYLLTKIPPEVIIGLIVASAALLSVGYFFVVSLVWRRNHSRPTSTELKTFKMIPSVDHEETFM